jgi:hypothetical protein
MISIGLLGAIIEIISMLLFFIVVFYAYNIRSISRGINGWNYIAAGFLFMIFRNFFGFLLRNKIDLDGETIIIIIRLAEPIILLLITVLFIIGFYKLDQDFKKIRNSIIKNGKRRKKR